MLCRSNLGGGLQMIDWANRELSTLEGHYRRCYRYHREAHFELAGFDGPTQRPRRASFDGFLVVINATSWTVID
jgi:hypothetical protein